MRRAALGAAVRHHPSGVVVRLGASWSNATSVCFSDPGVSPGRDSDDVDERRGRSCGAAAAGSPEPTRSIVEQLRGAYGVISLHRLRQPAVEDRGRGIGVLEHGHAAGTGLAPGNAPNPDRCRCGTPLHSGAGSRPGSRYRCWWSLCRAFTSGWTGGISVRSNSSTYSACSRSAAASGTVMRLFSDPSHGTFRVAGSPGATTGPPRRRVSVFQAVAVLTGLSLCGSRMRQVEPPGSMSFQSSPRRTHLVPHTSSSSSPRAEWARVVGPPSRIPHRVTSGSDRGRRRSDRFRFAKRRMSSRSWPISLARAA